MNKNNYPIKLMCEELEISRDSYYKYINRKNILNIYDKRRMELSPLIIKYYNISNCTAGYRQIRDQIEFHENIYLSEYMVYKIKCKDLKLPEIRKKRNKGKYTIPITTKENQYRYDNIAETVNINDINQVLSTDTTEVSIDKEKQNISFIIDAYTSEVLVSCISKKLDNEFIELNMNLLEKKDYDLNNIIIHSDRGGMYRSGIYKTKTTEMNLIPSMSAPFTCTHNPWIETLNGQFKDFIKINYPKNLDELKIALNNFVHYNNNIKIKRKLKTTPIQYRCCNS